MGIARKLSRMNDSLDTDVVVVGAGPAGLYQLFQLSLHGLRCHAIEALPHSGGQCAQLYPDKPIYDIPAVPACSGTELAALLHQQLAPFDIGWHWGEAVVEISAQPEGVWQVRTAQGLQLRAKAIVLAVGVGAFVPRPLKVEGLEPLLGTQVFMQSHDRNAPVQGADVVILGGDEAAVGRALALAQLPPDLAPRSIHLLHRRDVFKADAALLAQLEAQRTAGRIEVAVGQLQELVCSEGRLRALQLLDLEGQSTELAADVLLVYQGISPKLSPLAEWGLQVEQKMLPVDAATFATNLAGVYAIGDIAQYPGKRKLIACAFHEATLAGYAVTEYVQQSPVPLQFTTTSTKFLQRLGKLPAQEG